MCGLAGLFAYRDSAPPVAPDALVRMRERMITRGPDDAGLWLDTAARIGLAHRRLSILDPRPTGAQPMWSADGRYGIVFNGEIYNFRVLRAEAARWGLVFRTQTDTEVLLALYARQGAAMCARLRGMYAFAIWDQEAQALFMARDPFGIKPLYLHDDGQTLRFASQVKALLAGGGLTLGPEPAGVAGYWLWGHVPEPWSLYRGLVSLSPGSWLRLERGGGRRQGRFQDIHEVMRGSDSQPGTGPSVVDEPPAGGLQETLRDSVAHHLIADVPVGVFLSAGIDSATIAALAAETGGSLRTVTLGFAEYRGTAADETILAAQVARRYGARHETVWITRRDFEDVLDDFIAAMDQPSTDGLNTWLVARAAAGLGLKVALSGLGGDELFGGYPSFRHLPLLRLLARPFAAAPAFGPWLRRAMAPVLGRVTSVKYAGLLEYGATWEGAYLLRRALRMPWEQTDLARTLGVDAPEMLAEGWERLMTQWADDPLLARLGSPHAIVSYLETTRYMRDRLLRDTDWAGMAHALEVRVPFVDIQVLRAVVRCWPRGAAPARAIPAKRDLAASARPPLPEAVVNRPKSGFSVPVRDWLLAGSGTAQAQRGLRGWQVLVADRFRLAGHP